MYDVLTIIQLQRLTESIRSVTSVTHKHRGQAVNSTRIIWLREPRTHYDGHLWSAYCDELGLGDCGATEASAKENLEKSVLVYCRTLGKHGILEKRLTEKGIRFEEAPSKVDRESKQKLIPVLV